jgi:hypothetical protein
MPGGGFALPGLQNTVRRPGKRSATGLFCSRNSLLFLYVIANLFYSLIIGYLSGTLHSSKHYTRELGDE